MAMTTTEELKQLGAEITSRIRVLLDKHSKFELLHERPELIPNTITARLARHITVPNEPREFPVIAKVGVKFGTVPRAIAEAAYLVYAKRYGTSQSLNRMAERGGFHAEELDELLNDWRTVADTTKENER